MNECLYNSYIHIVATHYMHHIRQHTRVWRDSAKGGGRGGTGQPEGHASGSGGDGDIEQVLRGLSDRQDHGRVRKGMEDLGRVRLEEEPVSSCGPLPKELQR